VFGVRRLNRCTLISFWSQSLNWALIVSYKLALVLTLLSSGMESEAKAESESTESKQSELEKYEESDCHRSRKKVVTIHHVVFWTLSTHEHGRSMQLPGADRLLTPGAGHYLANGHCAPLRC
jgi:hypothetical protein